MATMLGNMPRLTEHSTKMMTLREAMCPVCREIIIEPVTMPCNHIICLQCFELTVEKSNLSCPLCRKRLGSWLRSATKGNQLVNVNLWERIKATFPDLVKAKLSGCETNDDIFDSPKKQQPISTPGEIRKEYERSLEAAAKEAEIERKKREKEERASLEFIRKLQEDEDRIAQEAARKVAEEEKKAEELIKLIREEEDKKRRKEAEQARLDELLAKELEEKTRKSIADKKAAGPSGRKKGPMDHFLMANRSLSNLSNCSHDSIKPETVHFFKPLRPFPVTPPKKDNDGTAEKVSPVKITPHIVSKSPLSISLGDGNRNACSPVSLLNKQTSLLQFQRSYQSCSAHAFASIAPSPSGFKRVLDLGAEPAAKRMRISADTPGTSSDFECDQVVLQLRAEKILKQEHADFLLAQALQKELNDSTKVDRRKGTERAYQLRKAGCPARQTTLAESFGKKQTPGKRQSRSHTTTSADSGIIIVTPEPSPKKSPRKAKRQLYSPLTTPSSSSDSSPSLRSIIDANLKHFEAIEQAKRGEVVRASQQV